MEHNGCSCQNQQDDVSVFEDVIIKKTKGENAELEKGVCLALALCGCAGNLTSELGV